MKDKETDQARTLARARVAPAPDMPVRVDTAMQRCAAMYLGATGRPLLRTRQPVFPEIGTPAWWRRVRTLAALHD